MIEYRSYKIDRRAASDRSVSGYACVFNSESRDLGFYETIAPGAIDEATIKKSDVFAVLNHDRDKVFARSKYGVGSLELSLDGHGLHYRFDAPNNDLGNSLLEYIDRGDIDESSFAFVVDKDYWEKRDGVKYRTILHISELFDVSPVWEAAYSGTEVAHRNMPSDYETELRSLDENKPDEENMDDKKIAELEEELKALRAELEKVKEEEPKEEPKEEPEEPKEEKAAPEEPKDEPEEPKEEKAAPEDEPEEPATPDDESDEPKDDPEEEEKECPAEDKKDEENRKNDKNIFIKKMENKQKFSLVKELRNAVETGKKIEIGGLMSENRGYSVADNGDEVVVEDTLDIVAPLYNKNVLVKAGAHFLGGMPMGTQKVPVMTASQLLFKAETGTAEDGSGDFDSIELTPHRITGIFPISLELLYSDEGGRIETAIRNDIAEAFNQKLESSILGTSYGAYQPDSLGYILGSDGVAITGFDDLCYVEAQVERANIPGEKKYIVSPEFKSVMRNTIKGTNNTGMVWENNEIDGTPAESTSHVEEKNAFYGSWNDLYIAQFGPVTIETVRDAASLADGKVNIVLNAFVDWKTVHDDSIKLAYVS